MDIISAPIVECKICHQQLMMFHDMFVKGSHVSPQLNGSSHCNQAIVLMFRGDIGGVYIYVYYTYIYNTIHRFSTTNFLGQPQ